jgi:hypothetical protein
MSGGEWKNAAMRLRDTAGNYLAAAVAYYISALGDGRGETKQETTKGNQ